MSELAPQKPVRRPAARRRPRLGDLLCVVVTALGLLWLLAVVILQRGFPENYLPAFLAVYSPQVPLLAPLVGASAICLLAGRPRWLGLNLLLLGISILLLIPPVLGRAPQAVEASRRIRIVSWNVHEEYGNVPTMRRVVAALKPDIVCLQEARQPLFYDALPGAAVGHANEVTTLTRGRILRKQRIRLGPYPNFRRGLETVIELPQGRLSVFNVHYVIDMTGRLKRARQGLPVRALDDTQQARRLENEAVLRWLNSTPGPRVVVGDFNTPPNAAMYRDLKAVATDAFGKVGRGWGFTYRRDRPVIRIDYVWCAGKVEPVACRPRDGEVSDHRLLVTDLLLPAPGGTPTTRPQPPEPAATLTAPEDTR